jgi:outer membrane immunogenic protein
MKKLAIGILAATALSGSALAADMPLKARPLPVEVFSWTGCYVGLNGGWFRESVDTPAGIAVIPPLTPTAFPADHVDLGELNANSGAIGGQVGCRWQTASQWVFGVEGDFDWTDLHGTVTHTKSRQL